MTQERPDTRRPSSQTPFDESVNVNTATYEQLRALPGIGDGIARSIMDWRERHGTITHMEMLRDEGLIPADRYDELSALLRV
ncbi:ComEA family DNA-binding protein [Arenibaculum pallidiluteum]|uniref:ComEA family DNA-binding protein n=1 Tax=Arenibaculum pallidiluteum TaxID=2812559 RepID=UPI001A95C7BB|nr:helix-hairpin-helix domain-containing protein [Arenibaculum pallidiluteum]